MGRGRTWNPGDSIVTTYPVPHTMYQLRFVKEIRNGKLVTYPGYARVQRSGLRPTIIDQYMGGGPNVASDKGALEKTRAYLDRHEKGSLPAPWERIKGVVLTRCKGTGKVKYSLGRQRVQKGPQKRSGTTEWLYYVDKDGNEYSIESETKRIGW